jgi:predicted metal-dependent hydrolase
MAFKELKVPDLGTVRLYKRRGNRSIKLSLANDGTIRVSIPTWIPYSAGLTFAKSKSRWIKEQQDHQLPPLQDGQSVGKAHKLFFVIDSSSKVIKTKITGNRVCVSYPLGLSSSDSRVQKKAQEVIRRALRAEAEILLPQRIQTLAQSNGFSFNSVSVRYLKRRWGSCNQKKDIVLNIFLMEMPWRLIDYVIMHELTHTEVLHHGPIFWDSLEKRLPGAKKLRKEIRNYQPHAFFNEHA